MDLEGMNYNVVLRMVQQFPSGVNIEAVEQGIRALLLTPTTENTVAEFDKKLVMLAYSIWDASQAYLDSREGAVDAQVARLQHAALECLMAALPDSIPLLPLLQFLDWTVQTGETLIKLEQYMHLGSLLKETATLHEKLHKMFHAMEVDDLDRQATGKMLFHLLLLQVWAAIHVQETMRFKLGMQWKDIFETARTFVHAAALSKMVQAKCMFAMSTGLVQEAAWFCKREQMHVAFELLLAAEQTVHDLEKMGEQLSRDEDGFLKNVVRDATNQVKCLSMLVTLKTGGSEDMMKRIDDLVQEGKSPTIQVLRTMYKTIALLYQKNMTEALQNAQKISKSRIPDVYALYGAILLEFMGKIDGVETLLLGFKDHLSSKPKKQFEFILSVIHSIVDMQGEKSIGAQMAMYSMLGDLFNLEEVQCHYYKQREDAIYLRNLLWNKATDNMDKAMYGIAQMQIEICLKITQFNTDDEEVFECALALAKCHYQDNKYEDALTAVDFADWTMKDRVSVGLAALQICMLASKCDTCMMTKVLHRIFSANDCTAEVIIYAVTESMNYRQHLWAIEIVNELLKRLWQDGEDKFLLDSDIQLTLFTNALDILIREKSIENRLDRCLEMIKLFHERLITHARAIFSAENISDKKATETMKHVVRLAGALAKECSERTLWKEALTILRFASSAYALSGVSVQCDITILTDSFTTSSTACLCYAHIPGPPDNDLEVYLSKSKSTISKLEEYKESIDSLTLQWCRNRMELLDTLYYILREQDHLALATLKSVAHQPSDQSLQQIINCCTRDNPGNIPTSSYPYPFNTSKCPETLKLALRMFITTQLGNSEDALLKKASGIRMYLSLSDRKEFLEMLHMANQLLHSVPVGAYPTLEVEWLHITSWNRALGEVFLGNDLYTRSVLDLSVKFARRGGLLSGRELDKLSLRAKRLVETATRRSEQYRQQAPLD